MSVYYKDYRERLDELLEQMVVPKIHYYNLTSLNKFICYSRTSSPFAKEAVEIIHKIAPMPLVKFPVAFPENNNGHLKQQE